MSKRLVVLFFPKPHAGNLNPHPQMLMRCNPRDIDDMVQRASNHALPDLTTAHGRGKVLIGREHEAHIINQDARHPSAIEWEGPQKSGRFDAFVRQHSAKFFDTNVTA